MGDVIARESAHTSGLYQKRDVVLVRGEGAVVWDAAGREYIDCVGAQGMANLGHGNVAVAAAIGTQARTLELFAMAALGIENFQYV
ncbi:MAG: LysW-gamma-L-lysine/LysW-L-ornithine aminotransferase, partial [Chloroflexota bacterium]|nr:LysW-gamma-L-lysine/LysW-L-ornithine aminotransferase [Chloroflexota bacterium]